LIAFGGGGPVHAYRIAEKIGVDRVLVPSGAGVGSAIGFLRAPIGYEVVRSLYQRLSSFDTDAVNALLDAMVQEAEQVVAKGSFGAPLRQSRTAYMRYVGQGHEVPVALPARRLRHEEVETIRSAYDAAYARFYDRPVPGSDVEILSYAVVVSTVAEPSTAARSSVLSAPSGSRRVMAVRDTVSGEVSDWRIHDRWTLARGAVVSGPAIIAENETSTLVGPGWSARMNDLGYIELAREAAL
jgi:N-methylhydantoinase A